MELIEELGEVISIRDNDPRQQEAMILGTGRATRKREPNGHSGLLHCRHRLSIVAAKRQAETSHDDSLLGQLIRSAADFGDLYF